MLLTLMLLTGWHWPTPEQVLYPTTEARLQACLTAKSEPTAADLKQVREAASRRTIYFVPPVNALAGACIPPDARYPAVVKAAEEFKNTLQNGKAPPPNIVVTLGLAPKVGRFRVETRLRSRVQHRLSLLAQGTV